MRPCQRQQGGRDRAAACPGHLGPSPSGVPFRRLSTACEHPDGNGRQAGPWAGDDLRWTRSAGPSHGPQEHDPHGSERVHPLRHLSMPLVTGRAGCDCPAVRGIRLCFAVCGAGVSRDRRAFRADARDRRGHGRLSAEVRLAHDTASARRPNDPIPQPARRRSRRALRASFARRRAPAVTTA
jgi:hypothetical protein